MTLKLSRVVSRDQVYKKTIFSIHVMLLCYLCIPLELKSFFTLIHIEPTLLLCKFSLTQSQLLASTLHYQLHLPTIHQNQNTSIENESRICHCGLMSHAVSVEISKLFSMIFYGGPRYSIISSQFVSQLQNLKFQCYEILILQKLLNLTLLCQSSIPQVLSFVQTNKKSCVRNCNYFEWAYHQMCGYEMRVEKKFETIQFELNEEIIGLHQREIFFKKNCGCDISSSCLVHYVMEFQDQKFFVLGSITLQLGLKVCPHFSLFVLCSIVMLDLIKYVVLLKWIESYCLTSVMRKHYYVSPFSGD